MGQLQSWDMVGGYKRPNWAGPVTISDNRPGNAAIVAENPRTVFGMVVPVTTAARGTTPKPLSGAPTGKSQGTDKGHMMALELGGPDISANISPQTSLWQQSGGWRAVEVMALNTALELMSIGQTYDPAGTIPMPNVAAFFRVSPLGTVSGNAEPQIYEGIVVQVRPDGYGSYSPIESGKHRIFMIKPGGVWCDRQGNPL